MLTVVIGGSANGTYLTRASEGWGKVMFSQMSVHGGRGVPQTRTGYPSLPFLSHPLARTRVLLQSHSPIIKPEQTPHSPSPLDRARTAMWSEWYASCDHAGGLSCPNWIYLFNILVVPFPTTENPGSAKDNGLFTLADSDTKKVTMDVNRSAWCYTNQLEWQPDSSGVGKIFFLKLFYHVSLVNHNYHYPYEKSLLVVKEDSHITSVFALFFDLCRFVLANVKCEHDHLLPQNITDISFQLWKCSISCKNVRVYLLALCILPLNQQGTVDLLLYHHLQ